MRNRLFLSIIVSMLISLMAWALPVISGRWSYGQFALALVATAVTICLIVVGLCPLRHRRAVGVRLMAVGFGVSLTFAMAELLAFVWPTDHLADNPWYLSTGGALAADNDLPWVRPPNLNWTGSSRGDLAMETNSADPDARVITFQTDFEGFRNSRDLSAAELLFIGDSFTEAGNVPEQETFVWLTERGLNATARNMGVAGYGPPMELIALQKFGLKCKPRIVIWQIAETNDLDDAVFFAEWQQAGRPSVLPGFSNAKPTRWDGWRRRSPTNLLYGLLRVQEETWPFCGDFMDRDGIKHTVRFEMSFPHDARQHPGWLIVEYSLTAGAQLLKENNVELVVLLIPRKLRVLAPLTDIHEMQIDTPEGPLTVRHTLPTGWDSEPEGRLAYQLKTLCDRLEVTYVDATSALTEEASAGTLVYQAMDTHLSPEGHKIVSRLLVNEL